jgi:hypothetical protein
MRVGKLWGRMGPVTNVFTLLLGLTAFVSQLLSRATVRKGVVNLIGGAGIFALLFSVVSPNDDLVQQELIRPAIAALTPPAHVRFLPRQLLIGRLVAAMLANRDRSRVPRSGHLFLTRQTFENKVCFSASISIHSPPGTRGRWP